MLATRRTKPHSSRGERPRSIQYQGIKSSGLALDSVTMDAATPKSVAVVSVAPISSAITARHVSPLFMALLYHFNQKNAIAKGKTDEITPTSGTYSRKYLAVTGWGLTVIISDG